MAKLSVVPKLMFRLKQDQSKPPRTFNIKIEKLVLVLAWTGKGSTKAKTILKVNNAERLALSDPQTCCEESNQNVHCWHKDRRVTMDEGTHILKSSQHTVLGQLGRGGKLKFKE